MFLEPLSKCFLRIHQCIPYHTLPCHIYVYKWLHFSFAWNLDPWESSGGFWWWYPLWNTPAPHDYCTPSWSLHWAFCDKAQQCVVSGCCQCQCSFCCCCFWVWLLDLILILLRAHTGYLHLVRALYRWSSSCFNSWGFEQMVFALWCRVPITLYLDGNVGRGAELMRTIKEALYIRVNNPSLNRNIGKYHLPHIWDEVLFNTWELK